ncbi:MAG TPA: DUF4256 domain-containing protein [Cyclobacteriaceae bacterium]|nr:DUF4256 domain-containing protein [Cyclobacteriaceae bacterium]
MAKSVKKNLSDKEQEGLLALLAERFRKNIIRHKGIEWPKVLARLNSKPDKLWSLHQMESTGGEPDVVGFDRRTGEYIFFDCSAESPSGRRSLCYDDAALKSRKEFKPKSSAMQMAAAIGVSVLSEEQYRSLQLVGEFDLKTSSWVLTPPDIRKRGGALFCDRRYDHVFTYHNGAESYYAARGFRAVLSI